MSKPAGDLEALLSRGTQFFQAGDFAAAEQAFAEAAQLEPDAWQIHFNLGMCRDRQGQREQAFLAYETAYRLNPEHIPSLTNLAVNAFNLGKNQLALDLALRQVELEPESPLAYDNLGQIFRHMGQYEAAELCLNNALLLKPDAPAIHNHLGVILLDRNKPEAAEAAFRTALSHDLTHVDAYTNLSCLYLTRGQLEEALSHSRKAVGLAPQSTVAWTNLGNSLKAIGFDEEAHKAYARAVDLSPQHPLGHWNLAISLLTRGQLTEGWQEYEWGAAAGARTRFSNQLPLWRGEDLRGRRLLLRVEQGLGDTIQFVRFALRLQAKDVHLTLECQPALLDLLQGTTGIERVVPQVNELPGDAFGCDLYIPLMSLPFVLNIGLADLPGEIPYLGVPAERSDEWRRRLGERKGLRVGLVCAGNPLHRNDRQRSCQLQDLGPILAAPGIEFISLQMGANRDGLPESVRDIAPGIRNFADTAAAIENLDLLITVDTAVAHLAGALGRPAWVMLAHDADWRWLRNREDTPWYPTLSLYRQKVPGQWLPVAEQIAADLTRLASGISG